MPETCLVVGAGAAGLAAVRTLSQAGAYVEILEARERTGGRIHTLEDPRFPNAPFELGAEFVHGKPPEIFRDVRSGGLRALEVEGGHFRVNAGEVVRDDGFFDRVEAVTAPMATAPEQSFQEFIAKSGAGPDLRAWTVRYVEGFNAARQELISIRSLAQQDAAADQIEGDRLFRLERGYRSLIENISAAMDHQRVRIHLGTIVRGIRWSRGRVEILATSEGKPEQTFEAPRAIITAPVGVLQSGAIRFDPEPPNLRAALAGIVMGHAARITLRFRRPIWEDRPEFRDVAFLHSGEEWMPTWWTTLPVRAPVITGWMGGPGAESAARMEESEWLPRALATLARLIRVDENALRGELEAWHAHNWSADRFSRGAYSYVRVGGLEAQRHFAEPVEDTLFFAGEATNTDGHAGTVHGAIATGERAARQILKTA